MNTDILNVLNEHVSEETILLHMKDRIFDFSLPLEDRMIALNQEYKDNSDQIYEVIKKLNAIYCMSPVGVIRKFLYEIAKQSTLPVEIRLECAVTLKDIESSTRLGLECIDLLFEQSTHLPIICRFDYMIQFMNTDYKDKYDTLLKHLLVQSSDIPIEWRYKRILSLKHLIGEEYMIHVCKLFIENTENELSYRILGCQNLLSIKQLVPFAEDFLLRVIRDTTLEHRARADAADVILHMASNDTISEAEQTLKELGGVHTTFYENKENVHSKEIDKSIKETIQYLDTLKISPIPSFDTVSYNILKLAEKKYRERLVIDNPSSPNSIRVFKREVVYMETLSEKEEKIKTALLRVELDRTTFKDVNHTLQSILCLIYAYIDTHTHKYELQRRMLEELIDMSGTCTTGYIHRFVNILSGFGHTIRISWEDQIVANLKGRLNAKLRECENMDIVLEQMTNRSLDNRSEFFRFFRKHISSIREEMYQEFKPFMEDLEWDEYFQKAILFYEQ